jgi:tetratricopeptide (TPR) repeat protein
MKRSYSLAAVLAVLMTWHALAASALRDPTDEFYNNAMGLYEQGRFAEALPLAQKLVVVDEKALGPNHLDFAKDLNLLGLLYHQLRHYAEAQTAYERSLAIREKQLRPDHPDIAQSLSNLGLLYIAEGHYADAERVLKRALAIRVKAFKPDHPDIGLSLRNVGNAYAKQGRCADAEPLYKQSLQIFERVFGASSLCSARARRPRRLLLQTAQLC